MLLNYINPRPRGAIMPFVVVEGVLLVSGKGVKDGKIFVIAYKVFGFLRGVFFWVLFRAGRRSAGAGRPFRGGLSRGGDL